MHNQYFQQKTMNPFGTLFETPVKEFMELNMKAMQRFSYLMPTELLSMHRPEEMMEKNLELLIENSHTAMAYMQNMCELMEKHWLKNTKGFSELVKAGVHTATSASSTSAKKATKTATAKTTTAKAQPSANKAKPAATKVMSSKTSTMKKPSTAKPSASKSSMSSSSKLQTGTSTSSMSQHFSPNTAAAKPMMKEFDVNKKI